jgi:hypothetical protein
MRMHIGLHFATRPAKLRTAQCSILHLTTAGRGMPIGSAADRPVNVRRKVNRLVMLKAKKAHAHYGMVYGKHHLKWSRYGWLICRLERLRSCLVAYQHYCISPRLGQSDRETRKEEVLLMASHMMANDTSEQIVLRMTIVNRHGFAYGC